MTRRPLVLLAAVATTLGLAACGERSEDVAGTSKPPAAKLSLLLDYLPNADHAGIFQAQSSGAFTKAGLDVDVKTPDDPATVLKLVETGKVDVGISYEPEVLLARAQGQNVVAIAGVVQRPLTSLISLPKAGIAKPADLEGKTVGTAGIPYQNAYLDTIAKSAGISPSSIKRVDVGFNLDQALVSGKVDATLGGFWNVEGVELQQKKRDPRITPVDKLGVPSYAELVLVARGDTLTKKESSIRRLVRAIGQGYQVVRKNPSEGVNPLLKANEDLDPKLQEAAVAKTVDAFFPTGKNAKQPWGWLDTDQWADYAQWMLQNGLLKKQLPLDNVVTTDFLAGEGAGVGRKTPDGSARPDQSLPGYRGE
ncbi:ABC transporter substrate-binding protein [Patulibacter minatonensis]|uniref:ABC transporter substrate-binding protein n=1 Tax=Patulibacter minatonensis TaxID=298163 RepID=UPI0004AE7477|nr:ABC transporter substrate-binding protein [Patulibacter minatonensis]